MYNSIILTQHLEFLLLYLPLILRNIPFENVMQLCLTFIQQQTAVSLICVLVMCRTNVPGSCFAVMRRVSKTLKSQAIVPPKNSGKVPETSLIQNKFVECQFLWRVHVRVTFCPTPTVFVSKVCEKSVHSEKKIKSEQ